ncbi:MAG: hypothetical protein U0930_15155 [Pirellulales bacterium]
MTKQKYWFSDEVKNALSESIVIGVSNLIDRIGVHGTSKEMSVDQLRRARSNGTSAYRGVVWETFRNLCDIVNIYTRWNLTYEEYCAAELHSFARTCDGFSEVAGRPHLWEHQISASEWNSLQTKKPTFSTHGWGTDSGKAANSAETSKSSKVQNSTLENLENVFRSDGKRESEQISQSTKEHRSKRLSTFRKRLHVYLVASVLFFVSSSIVGLILVSKLKSPSGGVAASNPIVKLVPELSSPDEPISDIATLVSMFRLERDDFIRLLDVNVQCFGLSFPDESAIVASKISSWNRLVEAHRDRQKFGGRIICAEGFLGIARLYEIQGKPESARDNYEKSIDEFELLEKNADTLAALNFCRYRYAVLLEELKKPEASQYFEKSIQELSVPDHANNSNVRSILADAYNAYGIYLQRRGSITQAIDKHAYALDHYRAIVKNDSSIEYHLGLIGSLWAKGSAHSDLGDGEEAIRSMMEAISLAMMLLEQNPLRDDIKLRLANCRLRLLQIDDSAQTENGVKPLGYTLRYQTENSVEARKLLTELSRKYPQLKVLQYQLANLEFCDASEIERSDKELARQHYRVSQALLEELRNTNSRSTNVLNLLIGVLINLAALDTDVDLSLKENQRIASEQSKLCEEINNLLSELFQYSACPRDEMMAKQMKAIYLLNEGYQLMSSHQSVEALEVMTKSIAISKELIKRFPSYHVLKQNLAKSYMTRISILAYQRTDSISDLEDAVKEFENGLDRKKCKRQHLSELVTIRYRLSEILFEEGRLIKCVEHCDQAIEDIENLISGIEADQDLYTAYFELRIRRALASQQLNRFEVSVKDFDWVLEQQSSVVSINRPTLLIQRAVANIKLGKATLAIADVEMLENLMSRGEFAATLDHAFTFAGIYSLASDMVPDQRDVFGDRSMTLLRLVAKEFAQFPVPLEEDKDFLPLRHRDDFQELCQKIALKREVDATTRDNPAIDH